MLVKFSEGVIKDVPTTLEVDIAGRVKVVPKPCRGWLFLETLSGWIGIADPRAADADYPWDGEYRGPEVV